MTSKSYDNHSIDDNIMCTYDDTKFALVSIIVVHNYHNFTIILPSSTLIYLIVTGY